MVCLLDYKLFVLPPSTGTLIPFMYEAASDAKKAIAFALYRYLAWYQVSGTKINNEKKKELSNIPGPGG